MNIKSFLLPKQVKDNEKNIQHNITLSKKIIKLRVIII